MNSSYHILQKAATEDSLSPYQVKSTGLGFPIPILVTISENIFTLWYYLHFLQFSRITGRPKSLSTSRHFLLVGTGHYPGVTLGNKVLPPKFPHLLILLRLLPPPASF